MRRDLDSFPSCKTLRHDVRCKDNDLFHNDKNYRLFYLNQHILGHKNVSTTQIYAAMADESKRESINRITLKPTKNVQLKVVDQ